MDTFWRALEDFVVRGMAFMRKHPEHTALLKGALALPPTGPTAILAAELQRLYGEWTDRFIAVGERTGAIRDDLPHDLLVAVVTSMAAAGDLWFANHVNDLPADPDPVAAHFTALMRRALAPD